jgi:hypothetical protein
MGDEAHGAGEHIPQARVHLRTGLSGPARGALKSTIRFFAPSVIVGLVAPLVFPAMRRAAAPVARGLVEGALTLGESIREGALHAREQMADMLVEVKAKREKEAAESAAAHKPDN